MKASERVWEFLEKEEINTRGEASEIFADAILIVAEPDGCGGNGGTLDALEAALDILCEDPKRLEELNRWLDEMDEDAVFEEIPPAFIDRDELLGS